MALRALTVDNASELIEVLSPTLKDATKWLDDSWKNDVTAFSIAKGFLKTTSLDTNQSLTSKTAITTFVEPGPDSEAVELYTAVMAASRMNDPLSFSSFSSPDGEDRAPSTINITVGDLIGGFLDDNLSGVDDTKL